MGEGQGIQMKQDSCWEGHCLWMHHPLPFACAQCLTNRYALTRTNTHIHTPTLTICEFLWLQSQKVGWIFVTTGIRHTLTHTICVHQLLLVNSPRGFFSTSHLYRWLVNTTAVMDGSGPQDLYNVYLLGWQWCARNFQDHAESMSYKWIQRVLKVFRWYIHHLRSVVKNAALNKSG